MADKSYYKNIGMDATAELNNKDAFGAAVMKAEQMLSQAMDSGENEGTDGAINEFMTNTLMQMYKNGEIDIPYKEFVSRLESEPMGYAGPMQEPPMQTKDDMDPLAPRYVTAQQQMRDYAADPDSLADAEMSPGAYQEVSKIRNDMTNGQDTQTDPRLRADLRSQLVARMRGVQR